MTKSPLRMAAFLGAAIFSAPQMAHAAGDATAGAVVFKRCAICHSTVAGQNKLGPSLAGIVGRKSGTAANYTYSAAMTAYGKTWTEAELDAYLTKPSAAVPGNKMPFAGIPDATDRANVIAYLSTLK